MKALKVASSTVAFFIATVFLAGCSNQKQSSKTLNWMQTSEITTLDPSLPMDTASQSQIIDTNEGLYRYAAGNKLEKALASQEKTSHDGLKRIYTLKKTTWSNGEPVTAQDFVYGWKRTVNPKTGSQYSYLLSGIKNADAIIAGKKKARTLGVKAEGKYKLVVNFEKPVPYFKQLLVKPFFFPENAKAVKKYGSKYGTSSSTVLTNGPFKIKNWVNGKNSWKLVKNPKYWDAKSVKSQTINFNVEKENSTAYNLYQSNKLDISSLSSSQAKSLSNRKDYKQLNSESTDYLIFNVKKNKYLKNANIRKAISLAISRQTLTTALGNTYKPAQTITPTGMGKTNGEDYTALVSKSSKEWAPIKANKKIAQQYLDTGLRELGIKSINIKLTASESDFNKSVTEALQSQLSMNLKGIKVDVQNLPAKSLMGRIASSNYDVLVVATGGDYTDPAAMLNGLVTDGSTNYGGWSDKSFDKLINQSTHIANKSKRYKLLAKAEGIALKNAVWSPLFYENSPWLIRTNVHGVVYNSDIWDMKTAYIK